MHPMAEQSFCESFLYVPSEQVPNLFQFPLHWMFRIHITFCEEESKSETAANWKKPP